MRDGWQDRLRTAALTAALVSVGWLGLFAWWQVRDRGKGSAASPPASQADRERAAQEAVSNGSSRPPPAPGVLAIPVAGVRPSQLVDTWGDARSGGRAHDAIDIMAPAGTPVLSAAPGTVEKLFRSDLGGITAYVRSDDRARLYYYAHLARYAPGLREGRRLRSGSRIGEVGSTGNADPSAPHLHFEVRLIAPRAEWYEDSRALNPYPLLAGTSPRADR